MIVPVHFSIKPIQPRTKFDSVINLTTATALTGNDEVIIQVQFVGPGVISQESTAEMSERPIPAAR